MFDAQKELETQLQNGVDAEARVNLNGRLEDIIQLSNDGEIGIGEYAERLQGVLNIAEAYTKLFRDRNETSTPVQKRSFEVLYRNENNADKDTTHWFIDGRYEIYQNDGAVYDTQKGQDIPQWIFSLRDFLIGTK